jgi:hypothetical protein
LLHLLLLLLQQLQKRSVVSQGASSTVAG